MSQPPAFQLLVFDMDGVLTDSTGCHARAFEDLWALAGVHDPPPYPVIAGRTTDAVVREYTSRLSPSEEQVLAWVAFKQERARDYLQRTGAFPDARPAVEALARSGYRMAVGTGASRLTTRMLLSRAGLEPFFPVVVTAEDVRRGKPAPDTFALAIEQSGAEPAASLVLEDSSAGLLAGVAAGAWVGAVRTGARLQHERFLGSFDNLAALATALTRPAR